MTAQIGDCDMDYIILDLGSDVNILTRQMLENYGQATLGLVSYPVATCKSGEGPTNW